MKRALNAWTFDSSLSMEQMFAAASSAGFEGIELNVDSPGSPHALSMETCEEKYKTIQGFVEKYSLPVCSISTSLWGSMMGRTESRADAEKLLYKQIEAASKLGADGILTVPGGMGDGISLDKARRNSIEFLKSQRETIEKLGIFVGVENVWNGFFLSPYDMVSFIDEIGSPMIGAYLDVGNMIAFSVSEYWVEVLGSRIGKVHVKDYKRNGGLNSGGEWKDITHGSADWEKIIPALRNAGYDGYLVGEVFKDSSDIGWDEYYAKVNREIAQICGY